MNIFKKLFSKAQPVAETSRPVDVLDYDDEGAANARKIERQEKRISELREKIEDLETAEETHAGSIRDLKRQHADELQSAVADLQEELRGLQQELTEAESERDKLAAQNKLEQEEIEHMIRLAEDRKELELKEEKLKLKEESAAEIQKVRDEYQRKLDKLLETQIKEGEKRFSEILARLPDVTARFKADLGN